LEPENEERAGKYGESGYQDWETGTLSVSRTPPESMGSRGHPVMVGRKTEGGVTVFGAAPGRLLAHGRELPLEQEPGGEASGGQAIWKTGASSVSRTPPEPMGSRGHPVMVGRKTEGGVTVFGAAPGRLLAHGRGQPLDQEPDGENGLGYGSFARDSDKEIAIRNLLNQRGRGKGVNPTPHPLPVVMERDLDREIEFQKLVNLGRKEREKEMIKMEWDQERKEKEHERMRREWDKIFKEKGERDRAHPEMNYLRGGDTGTSYRSEGEPASSYGHSFSEFGKRDNLGEPGGKPSRLGDFDVSTIGSHPSVDRKYTPPGRSQIKREAELYSNQSRAGESGSTHRFHTGGQREQQPDFSMTTPSFLEEREALKKPLLLEEENRGVGLCWDHEEESAPAADRGLPEGVIIQSIQDELDRETKSLRQSITFTLNQVKVQSEKQTDLLERKGDGALADLRREAMQGQDEGASFMKILTMFQSDRKAAQISDVELLYPVWENWRWERELMARTTKRDGVENFDKRATAEVLSVAKEIMEKCYEDLVEDWGYLVAGELMERTIMLYQGIVESKTISKNTARIFPQLNHHRILEWYMTLVPVLLEREREKFKRDQAEKEVREFLERYPGPACSPQWERLRERGGFTQVDGRGSQWIIGDPVKREPPENPQENVGYREGDTATLGFDNDELVRRGKLAMAKRTPQGEYAKEIARREALEKEMQEEARAREAANERVQQETQQRRLQEDRLRREQVGYMTEAEARREGANAGYNYAIGANPRTNGEYPHFQGGENPPAEINFPMVRHKATGSVQADPLEIMRTEEDLDYRSVHGSIVTECTTIIWGFEPGETRELIIDKTMEWVLPELGALGFETRMLEDLLREYFPTLGIKTKNQSSASSYFVKVAKMIKPQTMGSFINIAEWFRDLELYSSDYAISLPNRVRMLARTGGLSPVKEYEPTIRRVQELIKNIRKWLPEYNPGVEEKEGNYWLKVWMKVLLRLVQEFYQHLPVEDIEKGLEKELDNYKLDLQGEDVVNNQFHKVVTAYKHVNAWLRERSSNLGDSALYVWKILTNWLDKQEPYGPIMKKHLDKSLKLLGQNPTSVFPERHGLSPAALKEVRRRGQTCATEETYLLVLEFLKLKAQDKSLLLEFQSFGEMEQMRNMYLKNEEIRGGKRGKTTTRAANSVATDFSSLSMNTTTTAAPAATNRAGYSACHTCKMYHAGQSGKECIFVDRNNKFNWKAFLEYRSVRIPNEKGESLVSPFWIRELQARGFKALKIGMTEGKKIIEQLKAEAKKYPVLTKAEMAQLSSKTQKFAAITEKEASPNIQVLMAEMRTVAQISRKYKEPSVTKEKKEKKKKRKKAKEESESESESGSEEDDDSVTSGY
jgi:hypothetical protein